jgi:hypothetical protein
VKRFAIIDQYGGHVYDIHAMEIRATHGLVEVFDTKHVVKAVISLLPGHSCMEVCDVVAAERRTIEISSTHNSSDRPI